ncbi:MAG: phenylalanine--tRNA ligase subunit beta [Deltaproteobacteria bacterium]|jgi:phenylalanyl-tRNA synthetase beta chain|nr:phenylalanine--tRNA ligase subunit beta [Deltaproteobacteria bacterium]
MRIGLAWLGALVDLEDLTPVQVADKLTMIGLEVEDLFDCLEHLSQVVAGEVKSIKPHGRHLWATEVAIGAETVTVLTGAPNVTVGGVYPLAPLGAKLPAGPVKSVTMAGLASEGVLCSALELGLEGGAAGLMELPSTIKPGEPLKKLWPEPDWVVDLSITPNRADALSVRGVARDLAAALGRPLKDVTFELVEDGGPASSQLTVAIDSPEHCLRYCGRIVNNIKIGPSPHWLVRRLLACGLRAINNAVDVTNYVMLELGQPLHAFDLARVAENRIYVTIAKAGQEFTTLDGQTRVLKAEENIVIHDGEKAVGLGGVMGGLNSEMEGSTTDVFLEGATFNPRTIRKTSRALGLATDASYRFERGMDPNLPPLAVDRAAQLLALTAGGKVAKGRLDVYPNEIKPQVTTFSPKRCAALLGVEHPLERVLAVLAAIGVELSPLPNDADGLLYQASLPTYRPDLNREVDLIEEAVRLLDFEKLPATLPKPPAMGQKAPVPYRLRENLRAELAALGLSEIISYSFINPNFLNRVNIPEAHPWRTGLVKVLNPLSEDHGVLRPTLAPGLLAAVRLNQSAGRWSAALFEVGAIFLKDGKDPQPREIQTLGLILAGEVGQGAFNDPSRGVDFWDLKGIMEAIGEKYDRHLSFSPLEISGDNHYPFYELGQAAAISANGAIIGHLGEISPKVGKALGLKPAGGRVFYGELNLTDWPASVQRAYEGWSSYPGVTRDLAILVPVEVPAEDILKTIGQGGDWPLTKTLIFDLYTGEKIPSGSKGLGVRLFFQRSDRTLTDELVNGYFDAIAALLKERFKATLRA